MQVAAERCRPGLMALSGPNCAQLSGNTRTVVSHFFERMHIPSRELLQGTFVVLPRAAVDARPVHQSLECDCLVWAPIDDIVDTEADVGDSGGLRPRRAWH